MFRDRLDYAPYHTHQSYAKEEGNSLKFVIKDDKYKIDCELKKDVIIFYVDTDSASYVGKYSNDSLPEELKVLFQDVSELYQILLEEMHDILKYEDGYICIKNRMSKKEKWFNLPLQKIIKSELEILREQTQRLLQQNQQLKKENEAVVKENQAMRMAYNKVNAKLVQESNKYGRIIDEKDKQKQKLIEELKSLRFAVQQLVKQQQQTKRRPIRTQRAQTRRQDPRQKQRQKQYQNQRRPRRQPDMINYKTEVKVQQKKHQNNRDQRQKYREQRQKYREEREEKNKERLQKQMQATVILPLSAYPTKFVNAPSFEVKGNKITKIVATQSKYGNCQMILSPAIPKNEKVLVSFTVVNNPHSCHSFGITSKENLNKVYSANNINSIGVILLPYVTFLGYKPMTKMNKVWKLHEGTQVIIIIDSKENEITFKIGNTSFTRNLPPWYKQKQQFLPFLQLTDVGTTVQLN